MLLYAEIYLSISYKDYAGIKVPYTHPRTYWDTKKIMISNEETRFQQQAAAGCCTNLVLFDEGRFLDGFQPNTPFYPSFPETSQKIVSSGEHLSFFSQPKQENLRRAGFSKALIPLWRSDGIGMSFQRMLCFFKLAAFQGTSGRKRSIF